MPFLNDNLAVKDSVYNCCTYNKNHIVLTNILVCEYGLSQSFELVFVFADVKHVLWILYKFLSLRSRSFQINILFLEFTLIIVVLVK